MSSIGSIDSNNNYYQQINSAGSNSKSSKDKEFKTALDALVSDGTITQDQEDTIAQKLTTPSDDTISTSSSTTSTNSSNSDNPLKNSLDSLVSDRTITQDQEDTIAKKLTPPDKGAPPPPPPPKKSSDSDDSDNSIQSLLKSLVSDGTITDDQEDAITKVLTSQSDDTNSVTATSTGSSSTDNPLKSALDSLVSSGTISQDQKDEIAQTLSPKNNESDRVSSVYSELYGSTFSYLV